MIAHRRLAVYSDEHTRVTKTLVRQYSDPNFPNTIGQFFQPFQHNYLYGMTKEGTVARFLKAGLERKMTIIELYNLILYTGWVSEKNHQDFVAAVKAKARFGPSGQLLNNGELTVLFAEYNMKDQMSMMDAGNKLHLLGWGLNILTFIAAFGLNMSALKTFGLIFLSGASLTEAWSYYAGLTGSSIITFEFIAATFFKLLTLKKWRWYQWLAIVFSVFEFLNPLIGDPPLAKSYFLAGKSVLHAAHYVGSIMGWVMVRFLLPKI